MPGESEEAIQARRFFITILSAQDLNFHDLFTCLPSTCWVGGKNVIRLLSASSVATLSFASPPFFLAFQRPTIYQIIYIPHHVVCVCVSIVVKLRATKRFK